MTLILLISGLALLVCGAELLVRGATSMASTFGISSLVIGLTVVSFGTSAPELAVSINSSLNNQTGIAVGNALGSNIFNVLFILGFAAIIAPLSVAKQLVRIDVPVMIVVSIIGFLMAMNGSVSRLEGTGLFVGLITYTGILIYLGRKVVADPEIGTAEKRERKRLPVTSLVFLALGLGLLVLGSKFLVNGAINIAQHFKVSESIIGLTIIAAGTSLPELVTSVVASFKGQRDIAVGNVVGSNIFNVLGVLGVSAIVAPDGLVVSSSVIHFDFPIMLVAAMVCLPVCFTGGRISRLEGFFLFGAYLAYTLYLILAASHHDGIKLYTSVMLYFVIPLAAVTLFVSIFNAVRALRKPPKRDLT